MGRYIVNAIVCLIFGIGLLIGGFATVNPDTVTCHGEPMSPGETCTSKSKHKGRVERTYEEQAEHNATLPYILMGSGGFILLVGLAWGIGGAVKARNRNEGQNTPPPPPPQQGPPAQPMYYGAPGPGQGYGYGYGQWQGQGYPPPPPPQPYPYQHPPYPPRR